MHIRKTYPCPANAKATGAAVRQRAAIPLSFTLVLQSSRQHRSNSRVAAAPPPSTLTPDIIPEKPPTTAALREMQPQLKQLQKNSNMRANSSRARSRRSRSRSSRYRSITVSDAGCNEGGPPPFEDLKVKSPITPCTILFSYWETMPVLVETRGRFHSSVAIQRPSPKDLLIWY